MRNLWIRQGEPLTASLAALFVVGLLTGCTSTENVFSSMGTTTPPKPQESEGTAKADIDCPTVTVRTGASTWQVSAGGSGPTQVRYQGSLGQLARECAVLGETMTMRVGIEGRVLVGPKGGPGSVNVPLRIALVQEGPQPKPIWSKFYSIPVSVPQGASQAIFSHVEDDLTFPIPASKNLDNYVVYVGFDPKGAVPAPRPDAKSKAKAAPSAKTDSAPKAAKAPRQAKSKAATPSQPTFEPPPGGGSSGGDGGVFAPPPGQRGG
jgi:hypothetical protein